MNLSLFNSLCYTVGWFWCVLLGIHGHAILATLGAVFLILMQLLCTKIKNTDLYIQDVLLVVFSIPLGLILEILLTQTNLIHYDYSSKLFPPIWIIALYPLFSLLLNHSLRFMKGSYTISFLFGFLGAPFSYIAGVSLGGLTFPHPLIESWIMIGICWGLFLCIMTKIANIVQKATEETLKDRDKNNLLELLYDGECPICLREICILQKKNNGTKLNFVDISAKDYSAENHNNIDYNTAMTQIHAMDSEGNNLIGIPAFAAVYARCQLLIISTILRIPFIACVLNPFYSLFAQNRLWITGRLNTNNKK